MTEATTHYINAVIQTLLNIATGLGLRLPTSQTRPETWPASPCGPGSRQTPQIAPPTRPGNGSGSPA